MGAQPVERAPAEGAESSMAKLPKAANIAIWRFPITSSVRANRPSRRRWCASPAGPPACEGGGTSRAQRSLGARRVRGDGVRLAAQVSCRVYIGVWAPACCGYQRAWRPLRRRFLSLFRPGSTNGGGHAGYGGRDAHRTPPRARRVRRRFRPRRFASMISEGAGRMPAKGALADADEQEVGRVSVQRRVSGAAFLALAIGLVDHRGARGRLAACSTATTSGGC